jgi:2-amino-4-hydroxy-6-hydroxymethyldihydropteridine diphosphokinase
MADVYLGLGSNLGNRRSNLRAALAALRRWGEIAAVSRMYETEPVGLAEQPPFLNMACLLRTTLSPSALREATIAIERQLGRRPAARNGPRSIDIDILLYDELDIDEPELTIPHPRLAERRFVLLPLAEIAADVRVAHTGASVGELLQRLQDTHWVRSYNDGAMYRLFVEDHFDAAHYLPEYRGKCERMHGHRFKVVLRVAADVVGADGMAYDFA